MKGREAAQDGKKGQAQCRDARGTAEQKQRQGKKRVGWNGGVADQETYRKQAGRCVVWFVARAGAFVCNGGGVRGVSRRGALMRGGVARRGCFIQRDGAAAGRRGYRGRMFRKTTGGGARGGVRGSEARPRRVMLWGEVLLLSVRVRSSLKVSIIFAVWAWGLGGVRRWRRERRPRACTEGRTAATRGHGLAAVHAALTTRVQCVCCWGCCFTVAASDAPPAGCCWLEGSGVGVGRVRRRDGRCWYVAQSSTSLSSMTPIAAAVAGPAWCDGLHRLTYRRLARQSELVAQYWPP